MFLLLYSILIFYHYYFFVIILVITNTLFFLSDLSVNTMQHIPQELFQGNRKLIVIHLSGNSLKDLPEQIFKDLIYLEELDLSSNVLTNIQPGTFKGRPTYHPLSLFHRKMLTCARVPRIHKHVAKLISFTAVCLICIYAFKPQL